MRALDLFAGTGWGVACQRLGIEEMGVEIMPEAIATREANGMKTIYNDVWDGLDAPKLAYELLIASPPCQTFSMAGNGSGRKSLDEVIEAITVGAYRNAAKLRQFGEDHDPRTALVLTPLAHVFRDMPMFVAFEQVPTVLPVWEACAEVMRGWGYSVKVANLHAEQYGVPQTRKRAILVARRDGLEVQLPTPTHSKYHNSNPSKLDPGVLPWVSMAEALGWAAPDWTICHGVQKNSARRPLNEPAATIAFGHDSASVGFVPADMGDHLELRAAKRDGRFQGITVEEAATLQSYPMHLRSNYGTGGDASKRGVRHVGSPASTLTSKADRMKWDGERGMTVTEASTLQTYERPFVWCGTKGKQFLQIGNAVPPLLAQHVLTALTRAAEAGLEQAA